MHNLIKRYLIGGLVLAGLILSSPRLAEAQPDGFRQTQKIDAVISEIQTEIRSAVDDLVALLDELFDGPKESYVRSGIYNATEDYRGFAGVGWVSGEHGNRGTETSRDTLRRRQEELQAKVEGIQKQLEELRKQMGDKNGKNRQEVERQLDELQQTLDALQDETARLGDEIEDVRVRAEDMYLEQHGDVVRFSGDVVIDRDDVVDGHVVVTSGDIAVYGRVTGDVVAVEGNIVVKDSGYIGGDAITVNGEISKEGGGKIVGREVRKATKELVIEKKSTHEAKFTPRKRQWFPSDFDVNVIRYNRVDGVFLGLGSPKKYYWDGDKNYSLYGSIGYGFRSSSLGIGHWRGSLGFDRWFGDETRLEVGFEGHSLTDTKDDWIISQHENSLAAFFACEDYRDYYGREGYGLHVAEYIDRDLRIRADYLVDKYASLPNSTDWSLFGGNKTFRMNPEIIEGTMKSAIVSVDYSDVYERHNWREGLRISASAEFAGSGMGGEFDFNRYLVDARWYQPLWSSDCLNTRLRVGSSERKLPYQRSYEIGGLGTLPAYDIKQFGGNRMVLGNIEYVTNLRILDDLYFWPSGLLSGIDFIFFADAGWVQVAAPEKRFSEGFEDLKMGDVKSDLGCAFGFDDGKIRLGLAWRTTEKAPLTAFIRISRPF
jgi:septum formation inhibitor MinC